MRKKIALVSLLGNEALTGQKNGLTVYNDLEPLGLGYIASSTLVLGHDCRLFHPHQSSNPNEIEILRAIEIYKPDILGISSLTNNFPRSVEMAKNVKKLYPQIQIIFGGDHISSYPEDLKSHPEIDIAVLGEGEETFLDLIDNKPLDYINGIAYVRNNQLIQNLPRLRKKDRSIFPPAFRDPEIIKNSRIGITMLPSRSESTGTASILYQFGCPLGCTYCDATEVYGSKVTGNSPENVVSELADLKLKYGINTAFFTDLTFNLNSKKTEALCQKITKAELGIFWSAMIRPTSPKNQPMIQQKTLEEMARAGCTKIGFGIESIEETAMRDYHRPTDITEDYGILRKLDDLAVLSKVFLIIGHPEERPEYYDQVIKLLKYLCPDEVRISFLTPFPGTQLWKQMNHLGLIETFDYNLYTTFNPVIKMKHIDNERLKIERHRILYEYYTSNEFIGHLRDKTGNFKHLKPSFYELSNVLRTIGVNDLKID